MNLSRVRTRTYVRCQIDNPDKAPIIQVTANVLLLWLLLMPVVSSAQMDGSEEPKFIMNGYLKNMVSATVLDDSTLWDNLVHNRLNFKWYPNSNLSGFVDFRNRIFFGDQVKSINKLSEAFPGIVPRTRTPPATGREAFVPRGSPHGCVARRPGPVRPP